MPVLLEGHFKARNFGPTASTLCGNTTPSLNQLLRVGTIPSLCQTLCVGTQFRVCIRYCVWEHNSESVPGTVCGTLQRMAHQNNASMILLVLPWQLVESKEPGYMAAKREDNSMS